QSRERWPLRYPSRSGVRSCGSAPSLAATSSCMSASAITLTAERRKSTSPPVAAFPSWSSNAILSAAIVSVLPADVRHLLEDHAVALAVKGLDLHHSPGHYLTKPRSPDFGRFLRPFRTIPTIWRLCQLEESCWPA